MSQRHDDREQIEEARAQEAERGVTEWKRVILETPYAGDIQLNLAYLRACMHECIMRRWSPYASHGLLTQPGVLRDHNADERNLGIEAGLAWSAGADFIVVGVDLGLSAGMQLGLERHRAAGHEVVELSLPEWRAAISEGRGISLQRLISAHATSLWGRS